MQQIETEQLRTIGAEILPLIDARQRRTAQLAALGWEGFIAANRRSEDDWCDAGDLVLHHRLAEESLKESSFDGQVYCSLVLHQARKQFVARGHAARLVNWGPRAYLTPVSLAQLEDERGGYSRKWQVQQAYAVRAAQARRADLARVTAAPAPELGNSADAVFGFIESVQGEALAQWGFRSDKAMSVKHGPVLSRTIRQDWKLATTLPDRHLVYPRQFGTTANGNVSLTLVLAHDATKIGNLERALSRHPGRALVLSLVLFVNLRDQDAAVTAYVGAKELEARVRFHTDAISLTLPELIPALERALSFC